MSSSMTPEDSNIPRFAAFERRDSGRRVAHRKTSVYRLLPRRREKGPGAVVASLPSKALCREEEDASSFDAQLQLRQWLPRLLRVRLSRGSHKGSPNPPSKRIPPKSKRTGQSTATCELEHRSSSFPMTMLAVYGQKIARLCKQALPSCRGGGCCLHASSSPRLLKNNFGK